MRRFAIGSLLMLVCTALLPAHAAMNVFACEPEWGALAGELGGSRVTVFTATTAQQDPHLIEPRPSLIARARQSDLVVCTGADLEVAWLPLLLRRAGNARIQQGAPGYFEAASVVDRLDIPTKAEMAMGGDVHPGGNPHVHLDPRRLRVIAQKLTDRLVAIDREHAAFYRAREQDFMQRWQAAIVRWTERAAPLRGARFVSYHKDWVYLFDWLTMVNAGTLEPRPGIPPTPTHLSQLLGGLANAPARGILRTPYQDPRPAQWLSERAKLPVITLPYTVGGTPAASDLFSLFDDTIARLLGAPS